MPSGHFADAVPHATCLMHGQMTRHYNAANPDAKSDVLSACCADANSPAVAVHAGCCVLLFETLCPAASHSSL